MLDLKPQYVVGLAGVERGESAQCHRVDRFFRHSLLFVALVLALQWHFELNNLISPMVNSTINFLVWMFFLIETAVVSSLVKDKWRYFKHNWFNLVAIFSGVILLANQSSFDYALLFLRPVIFVALLLPWVQTFISWLSDNSIMTTLGTFAVVLVLFGVVMSALEPSIHNPLEGIWFALVTVTTVGYGDMVPVTFAGRVIASILIFTGLGLFAAITANFSAIFVRRGMKEEMALLRQGNRQIKQVLDNLQAVKTEEDQILETLIRVKQEESDIIDRLEAVKTEEGHIMNMLEFGKQDRAEVKAMLIKIIERIDSLEVNNERNHQNR